MPMLSLGTDLGHSIHPGQLKSAQLKILAKQLIKRKIEYNKKT